MRSATAFLCVAMIGFALAPGTGRTASRPADACLDCHGPFDKLTEATANWKAPSGERTSPHRYVPHDSRKASDVPDCKNCHAAHPVSPPPAAGSIDLTKVSVDWCYTTCHHEKNFTPCKDCHKTGAAVTFTATSRSIGASRAAYFPVSARADEVRDPVARAIGSLSGSGRRSDGRQKTRTRPGCSGCPISTRCGATHSQLARTEF